MPRQLVGQICVRCRQRVESVLDGDFCLGCGQAVHFDPCPEASPPTPENRCGKCGCDAKARLAPDFTGGPVKDPQAAPVVPPPPVASPRILDAAGVRERLIADLLKPQTPPVSPGWWRGQPSPPESHGLGPKWGSRLIGAVGSLLFGLAMLAAMNGVAWLAGGSKWGLVGIIPLLLLGLWGCASSLTILLSGRSLDLSVRHKCPACHRWMTFGPGEGETFRCFCGTIVRG